MRRVIDAVHARTSRRRVVVDSTPHAHKHRKQQHTQHTTRTTCTHTQGETTAARARTQRQRQHTHTGRRRGPRMLHRLHSSRRRRARTKAGASRRRRTHMHTRRMHTHARSPHAHTQVTGQPCRRRRACTQAGNEGHGSEAETMMHSSESSHASIATTLRQVARWQRCRLDLSLGGSLAFHRACMCSLYV